MSSFAPAPTFQTMIDTWYDQLYRFALSLSGDREEACELTRQALAHWAQQRHAPGGCIDARYRLFSALHREFLKMREESGNKCTPAADDGPGHLPFNHGVLAALQEIDPASRASLALLYLGEHSFGEIAEILAVPGEMVVSQIAQGKERLRRNWRATTIRCQTSR
jgi:DNA-directed RNA polymerase specialized sigma24 family protein